MPYGTTALCSALGGNVYCIYYLRFSLQAFKLVTTFAQVLTTTPKFLIVGNIKGSVIMMTVKYTTIKTAVIISA